MRVKCLAQKHNAMSPARALTWTARRSGDKRTNHEATAPPQLFTLCILFVSELTSRRGRRIDMVPASVQRGEYCGQIFTGKLITFLSIDVSISYFFFYS